MVPKISSVVIWFCFDEHFDFMYGLQIKSTKLDFNEYGFDNSIWTCILLANDQMSMTTKVLLIAFMSLGYKFYWNRLWNVCVNGNGPLIILRRRQTRRSSCRKIFSTLEHQQIWEPFISVELCFFTSIQNCKPIKQWHSVSGKFVGIAICHNNCI